MNEPIHCRACGTLSYSGRCDCTRAGIREAPDGPDLRTVSGAYCPKCSEPELDFGSCNYCGFEIGAAFIGAPLESWRTNI